MFGPDYNMISQIDQLESRNDTDEKQSMLRRRIIHKY